MEAFAAAAKWLEPFASLADIGSGAGLPGVPIQIFRPQMRVVLIESRSRKAAFLRQAQHRTGLSYTVFEGRAEEFGWEEVQVAALRAVNPSPALVARLERAHLPLLVFHGSELPGRLVQLHRADSFRVAGAKNRFVSWLASPGSPPNIVSRET